MGKALCNKCNKKCSGDVLKVSGKYYHTDCFRCNECSNSLAQGGFFIKDEDYFCTGCYQKLHGTRCPVCGDYVEGEVISTLGNTYHQKCFKCGRCRQPFPTGERVTFNGKEYVCQKCLYIPVVTSQSPDQSPGFEIMKCSGCKDEIKEGQALIALEQQWHIWCFKCHTCGVVLHGEYLGKDGLPYCEKDYQQLFGVRCAHCDRFIAGKVLGAGENYHFHPTCARCSKCGDPFGDGEEMYLQGTAIWHPRCGPGPTNGTALHNGDVQNGEQNGQNGHPSDGYSSDYIGQYGSRSPSLSSFRSVSPYNSLGRKQVIIGSPGLYRERDYDESPYPPRYPEVDITRIYTCSYLTAEPTQGYLKRPLEPRPPKSPQFHRPQDRRYRMMFGKGGHIKSGMKGLVESIASSVPRPRSPHMNNEEPIELAHFPDARPPKTNEVAKIERDDFPAPPFPYTDPERRRRWSDTYKGVEVSDDEEEEERDKDDPKLKKEEEELSKITASGMGKVFLKSIKEREKLRQWKLKHLDPRNASRTPSAAREPQYKLRYESPLDASPSRNMERPRPWEEDEMDRGSSYRWSGRSAGYTPTYNVVSSLRSTPKPGYGLATTTTKSATLPASGRNGGVYSSMGDYMYDEYDKAHSTDFACGKSDGSTGSTTEEDRHALAHDHRSTYSGLRAGSYSSHFRRSLPNMAHMSTEPPKIYPIHLLRTMNYRLPSDVDRCHLEVTSLLFLIRAQRHLSNEDFESIFHMSRMDFYRLPEWRRNDLKKRAKLF